MAARTRVVGYCLDGTLVQHDTREGHYSGTLIVKVLVYIPFYLGSSIPPSEYMNEFAVYRIYR